MMRKAQSMKSVRSMKSARSVKSLKSAQESVFDSGHRALEIDEYIKNGCQKFYCPYQITVVKETQRDDFYRTLKKSEPPVKYKKITVAPSRQHQATQVSDSCLTGLAIGPMKQDLDADSVVVTALYDHSNHLVELSFTKAIDIPRVLMQVIGLLVPYYIQLSRISLKKSNIDKYTIYELNKMLPLSTITEVCLDGSPLPEANYAILLEGQSCLRNLSLSQCLINDDACKQIANRLRYSEPSEATLSVLNLSSNHITDEGAKCIGEALRSNRHLRYLNLADNQITDDGASHIFSVLVEFPLTYEEVLEKRHRYSNYLRTRRAIFAKCLNEFDTKSVDEYTHSKKNAAKKKGAKSVVPIKSKGSDRNLTSKTNSFSDDFVSTRAEKMTEELIGPNQDPFGPGFVKLRDDCSYCTGNWVLCYLNISYNHLSYLSVKKLHDTVQYQQLNRIKSGQSGLIKVMLDGNYMPVACSELTAINDVLQRNLHCFGSRSYTASTRTKSSKISKFPSADKSVVL